jgi:hypothetical protein
LSPEIKSGIIHLQQNLDKLSLKDGLDLCLDAFCQFVRPCEFLSKTKL